MPRYASSIDFANIWGMPILSQHISIGASASGIENFMPRSVFLKRVYEKANLVLLDDHMIASCEQRQILGNMLCLLKPFSVLFRSLHRVRYVPNIHKIAPHFLACHCADRAAYGAYRNSSRRESLTCIDAES